MQRQPTQVWVILDDDLLRFASLRLHLVDLIDKYDRTERGAPSILVDAAVTLRELVERCSLARVQLPFEGMPQAVTLLQRGDELAFKVALPVIKWSEVRASLIILGGKRPALSDAVELALCELPDPQTLHRTMTAATFPAPTHGSRRGAA